MNRSPNRQPAPPYPHNIHLLKGALIALDDATHNTRAVPFQYNPATLSRRLRLNQLGGTDRNRSTDLRFTGAAVEMIQLEAHLEAVDAEAAGQAPEGLLPQLAALQLFAYPSTAEVSKYQDALNRGAVDIIPPLAPRLIFVWGSHRVLPVRLVGLEITEQLFDPQLNPVKAEVTLDMRVLTYSDVTPANGDYQLFFAHQTHLEAQATKVPQGEASRITGVNVSNPRESS